MPFSFRLRFEISETMALNIDEPKWVFAPTAEEPPVSLASPKEEIPIAKSQTLVLRADGYGSEPDALAAGKRYGDALARALARVRLGADFGRHAPRSGFTIAGLEMVAAQHGRRALNDIHGLMTFESEPSPLFARMGAKFQVGRGAEKFKEAFAAAVREAPAMSEREHVAFDLFSASFVMSRADARLLMLVNAVEALLTPAPRSDVARAHVDELLRLTAASDALTPAEKNSISGSLRWLRSESISQAGQRFVTERLRDRQYSGMSAAKFFRTCYDFRCRLVHGSISQPTVDEVGSAAAILENFVGDLLAGPVLELVSLE